MKRGLAYLFVVFGLIFCVTNATFADSEYYAINMDLNITDSFYTNLETEKSLLENDIVTEFEINLEVFKIKDDDDDDDDDENSLELKSVDTKFKVYLRIKLILPSGQYYRYSSSLYIVTGTTGVIIYFYNHATESGWYVVKIWGYLAYNYISAYDELIFDPPGGTDGGTPPSIQIFTV